MSIGSQLQQAREAQAISLDQAAQATHIRLRYLEALEANQFDVLSSTAQLRGFLRAYGDYLKLDSSALLRILDGDLMPAQPAQEALPASPDITRESTSSDAIFKEIGQTLLKQRELMGLSLGDVERHTHIRMHYVSALEEGDISHLPSPVQGRGMLSNYASFLGLNTETILLRFADGLQASLYNRQAARNQSLQRIDKQEPGRMPARPSQFRRIFSMELFASGFLILFLLGFAIWGALRISALRSDDEISPTAPPVSEILLSTPGGLPATTLTVEPASTLPIAIAASVEITATETLVVGEPTPGMENAPLQVQVIARQRAWMRVTVDGDIAFQGRVVPGSAYSFAGTQRIVLLAGDGSGLQVYFNQQDLGVFGSVGEVVETVFSIEGVQTATPAVPHTSTPVPTGTATITPTPTPTRLTPTPTSTPRP